MKKFNDIKYELSNNDYSMSRAIITILFYGLCCIQNISGQTDVDVDVLPKFNGQAIENYRYFIAQNLNYPSEAAENCVEGKVYYTFVVTKEAKIDSLEIISHVPAGCDEEVIRLVNLSADKWSPAIKDNEPVDCRFTSVVNFSMENAGCPSAKKHLRDATKALKSGDYETALYHFNEYIQRNPTDLQAYIEREVCNKELGLESTICQDLKHFRTEEANNIKLKYCEKVN